MPRRIMTEVHFLQAHPCVRVESRLRLANPEHERRLESATTQEAINEQGLAKARGADNATTAGDVGEHGEALSRLQFLIGGLPGRGMDRKPLEQTARTYGACDAQQDRNGRQRKHESDQPPTIPGFEPQPPGKPRVHLTETRPASANFLVRASKSASRTAASTSYS